MYDKQPSNKSVIDIQDKPVKHKRRVRYKGTHPRKFSEKYKELNPEQYPDDVKKVQDRGQTPAGMHLPICVNEICEVLQLGKGKSGIDCTLGYGGHSLAMLKRILPGGFLIGIDIDQVELEKTQNRFHNLGLNDTKFLTRRMNFSNIKDCLNLRPDGFDFILADLGVSSMQLDKPERGFSFKNTAPLDLRMDNSSGETAAVMLMRINEDFLVNILIENADEPYAELLGKSIITNRINCQSTIGLASVIMETLQDKVNESDCKLSVRRVFQALRIELNKEFDALNSLLHAIPHCLKSKGRIAILTFHSGEDRRVKKSFKRLTEEGLYAQCIRRPIRASFQEQHDNPRSSSAKLRWAEKA